MKRKVSQSFARNPSGMRNIILHYERSLQGYIHALPPKLNDMLAFSRRMESAANPVIAAKELEIDMATFSQQAGKVINAFLTYPAVKEGNKVVSESYHRGLNFANIGVKQIGIQATIGGVTMSNIRALDMLQEKNRLVLTTLGDDLKKDIVVQLSEGIQNGEGMAKLANRIQSVADGMEKTRAVAIARTETMNAFNTATVDRYREHGIERVEFFTAQDERVCEECGALHGDVFNVGLAPNVPLHVNCRCILLATEEKVTEMDVEQP
jgi:SPP1 gp7 family putative phage head morphogenesis protein